MKLFSMGMPVTINQRLDMDTIVMVADEFGFEVQPVEDVVEEVLKQDEEDRPEDLSPRPPIVTIMGHVDHGKTSLLDYTRKSNIIAGEAGGITQHIGAYEVTLKDGRQVTFLDTPGHEAFTAMRARGARVTDVVVLVVSADDNVMPQTVEAINHARAAEVPIVVAINKVDLPAADPAKIKRQLAEQNVLVEEWGGEVVSCEISAKTGQNVDHFLELLALQTEILELKANPNRRARGAVVEAELDRGRGPVATVLVQEGTLRVGDPFVVGVWNGRVRAMLDERGRPVPEAGPSRPVRVLGISGGVPQAGDTFHVMASEQEAREIAQKRQQIRREQDVHRVKRLTLSNIHERIQEGKMRELRLIVKGDVDGSVEALSDALTQLTHEEVRVSVIHRGVGGITESDVLLALASEAIIIGFNVRPDARAREVATSEVDIRLYRVIYEAIEDVKAALSGLLAPQVDEQTVGTVEVRETFHVPRAGTIAGCHVTSGAIRRNALVRVLRDSVVIFEGEVASLRRFKDDVREVTSGFECGVGIENFNDVKVGDVLEVYEMVETARTV
ncbi:MAG: translation initiation factor IF-2 [Candidatus Handelsmanbacteria bacterium RIFCSPLOWO2_12_FULL_64_10]|uniref:Translation initiation factor IF-2 n=1 Tax=Handelsmanbacteria sp. (strain RIFCSPLOWO2_12_FULL_64_10) TaxID=1817868 RepID=A0A1F6CJF1_HANXR|nr:MAG: translation initiation factor IF-2 [Candidatus Handelsmanbacteria bacterium RIFCSPLOWO2_12_FULL_64_10]